MEHTTADYLMWKLRDAVTAGDLTDYNSGSRAGTNWIYADEPRLTDLLGNKNNFPRIAITSQDRSTIRRFGMGSTQHHDLSQIAINVYVPQNLTCEINNVATETHTFNTGTAEYSLNYNASIIGTTIDGTLIGAPHSFIRGTDYQLKYGLYDAVEWLGVDEPDDGTSFICAYSQKASGIPLVSTIGRNIETLIRTKWLDWYTADHRFTNFNVISAAPILVDNYSEISRYEIFCSFKGIDLDA